MISTIEDIENFINDKNFTLKEISEQPATIMNAGKKSDSAMWPFDLIWPYWPLVVFYVSLYRYLNIFVIHISCL